MYAAAQLGDVAKMRNLLLCGASVEERAGSGTGTPLHLASLYGHVDAVELLLQSHAHVDAKTASDWTPLHCAVGNGHLEIARKLLYAGADHKAINKQGWTPMYVAADGGRKEMVQLLLEFGACIDQKTIGLVSKQPWLNDVIASA
jgi:ankyrin repeat protein